MAFKLDPLHESFDPMAYEFSSEIRRKKYYNNGKDVDRSAMIGRVVEFVCSTQAERLNAQEVITKGLFIPAGRILAGAGTGNRVTLVNCFVNETIEDSMEGIMRGLTKTALTMQQGGGMGTDFSTIRPRRARLTRTNSEASGPIPFMEMWDAMCATIMSAGSRRGAMMATMICTHPDVIDFILAKSAKGILKNFNVSVLVTEKFIDAIQNDAMWPLQFSIPPFNDAERGKELRQYDTDGMYTYKVLPARELWDLIMRTTYEYSEPGIIFIDRVNEMNNLNFCETIASTNPCGEQPLPPNGACNLGAVNLARMIMKPFQKDALLDERLLKATVNTAIKFLNDVIDVTNYPLPEQAAEQQQKRRIGLGIMGLADALIQLGIRYGSKQACDFVDRIMSIIANQAYMTSSQIARKDGAYPLYERDKVLKRPFIQKLQQETVNNIKNYGLANGVLLTVAPTGTTAIAFGNYSGGLEPNFRFEYFRKVRNDDGETYSEHLTESFIHRFAKHCGASMDPEIWVTAKDITVREHIEMQAACQLWVDASTSKTINLPEDISLEDFGSTYDLAYTLGCKGCTTYRPSAVRGSILSESSESSKPTTTVPTAEGANLDQTDTIKQIPLARPEILDGSTVKLKWPQLSSAIYMTVNKTPEGQPFEVFFNSKDSQFSAWMTALSLALTALMRHKVDPQFILTEFQQISDAGGASWLNGKRYDSLIALLGEKLGALIMPSSTVDVKEVLQSRAITSDKVAVGQPNEKCSSCGVGHMDYSSGCATCTSCGYSKC